MSATARLATVEDIPEVVRLRRVLFESLGQADNGWDQSCRLILESAIADDRVIVAVVDAPDGSGLAAAGTAEIQQRLPGPTNPSGRLGYIGTMATDRRWRRRGMARGVLHALLSELEDRDVERIELHATDDAEHMYRSAGFLERPGGIEMRLAQR